MTAWLMFMHLLEETVHGENSQVYILALFFDICEKQNNKITDNTVEIKNVDIIIWSHKTFLDFWCRNAVR